MTPAMLAALRAAAAERRCRVLATRLHDGHQILFPDPPAASDPVTREVAREAARAAQDGVSRRREIEGAEWFLHVHAPSPKLILIGAVHIAQCLAPMAALTGATVVVCDPRRAYATAARFPGTTLRHDWPDEAVRAERPGRGCAVVALSHDPKLDDPGLVAALATECGYVGALGSRRSHQARLDRLAAAGVDPPARARVMGPVGLAIGAVGAAEIAVAVLAEWVAQRRGAARRDRS